MQVPLRKRWQIEEKIPAETASSLADYSPALQQLLYNRKISDADAAQSFLTAGGSLHDPYLLTDMDVAVDRLLWALDQAEPIAVYGDYDVDGVTATALMVQVLRALGAEVRGYIPNRFDEGYGLNMDALDSLAQAGIKLILTVDCGIRAPNEVAHARQMGMDMIVSDHHEPREQLPPAQAVICPKREGDTYPEKNLAGVGLAFKIAEALMACRQVDGFDLTEMLDLVAVGTVADVVPLVGENRSLVRAGLARLRQGRRHGLRSLAGAANLAIQSTSARDIGFVLGPRLNAAGRLESALDSFDLLMADDLATAGLLAQKLDDQNRQRQELTRQMQETAEKLMDPEKDDRLIFAAHPEFNMGVVGLVAARLTETYYRPAVVGSQGEEFTRASCRSIPEFHITRALDQCSDLLVRHGGHAMAAGFTVRNEKLDELVERLQQIATEQLAERDLCPVLYADMEIPLRELRPILLKDLDALEPTGLGNPGALFVSRDLRVRYSRRVGSEGQHLRLTLDDGAITYDAIAFRQGHWGGQLPERVDILYAFERNFYRDQMTLQLNVRDLKPSNGAQE